MNYNQNVSFTDVISEWAKRERKSVNQLVQDRNPLLEALPTDTSWFNVTINKNDLVSFKVINNDIGWQLISDYSMEIPNIPRNVENPLKIAPSIGTRKLPNGRTVQKYVYDLITSLRAFRNNAGGPNNNLTMILIAPHKDGPFTILEGNHTAVALYFRHFIDHPEIEYPVHKSYVGISSSIENCNWF